MVSLNVLRISVALIKLELNNFIWFCHLFHLKYVVLSVSAGAASIGRDFVFLEISNELPLLKINKRSFHSVLFCLIMPFYAIDKFKSRKLKIEGKNRYANDSKFSKPKPIRVNRNFSTLIGK